MQVISNSQLARFASPVEERFVARLSVEISQAYNMPLADARHVTEAAIVRAGTAGIGSELGTAITAHEMAKGGSDALDLLLSTTNLEEPARIALALNKLGIEHPQQQAGG